MNFTDLENFGWCRDRNARHKKTCQNVKNLQNIEKTQKAQKLQKMPTLFAVCVVLPY